MQLATMTDRVFRAVTRSTMAERCRVKWGFVPRLFVVRLVSGNFVALRESEYVTQGGAS